MCDNNGGEKDNILLEMEFLKFKYGEIEMENDNLLKEKEELWVEVDDFEWWLKDL